MKTTKELNDYEVTHNSKYDLESKWFSEEELREIIRAVIWRIGMDEGGQILHYNDWVNDNWKYLLNNPTNVGIKKQEVDQK